ncbi:MAG: sugar phosphate isomerase/epimerase [Acidobacteriia bacterium]|nr:sugar phosphate isomerase/epimerase [Terriglobia bacterium]
MKNDSTRRQFLKASVVAACAGSLPAPLAAEPAPPPTGKLIIGVVWGMLPEKLSIADRFKLAADAGFQAVEAYTTEDAKAAEEIKKAAEDAKVRITSVMNQAHWKFPLSSGDPAAVKKGMDGMRTSLHNAQLWGADAVLLVPAVVDAQTSYQDAYTRSQTHIRELLPLAQELKVRIALEEVWNKFLLSPLEFRSYIDEFKSPWVKAYFDVGNVLLFGYPQDWIRTLGKRIVKIHLKDFKRERNSYQWVNLGEGDVDWAEVRRALGEIGYAGTVSAELEAGDLAYLSDVRKRIDRLVSGIQ